MSTRAAYVPTTRFSDAVALAIELHVDQTRKGTSIPYLSHLLGVASLVMENGGDEDQAIAGLLHDAVEDCGGARTADLIRSRFGDDVTDIVLACSDTDVTPKPPWLERKQAYIDHLATAPERALLVSLADKVHNARSIATDADVHGESLWDRFNATSEQSHWYYRSLCDVFEQRLGSIPLVGELRSAIDRIWAS